MMSYLLRFTYSRSSFRHGGDLGSTGAEKPKLQCRGLFTRKIDRLQI